MTNIKDTDYVLAIILNEVPCFVAEIGKPIEDWPETIGLEQCSNCGLAPVTFVPALKAYACLGTDSYGDGAFHDGCNAIYGPHILRAAEVIF